MELKRYSYENKFILLVGVLLFFSCEKGNHTSRNTQLTPGQTFIKAVKSTRQVFPNYTGNTKRISNCSYLYNSKGQLISILTADSIFSHTQMWIVSQYRVNYHYTAFNKISKIEYPGSTCYYTYRSDQSLVMALYSNSSGGFDTMYVKSMQNGYFTEFRRDNDLIICYYSDQLDSAFHLQNNSSNILRTKYSRNSKIDLYSAYTNLFEPIVSHKLELKNYSETLHIGSETFSYMSYYYREYDQLGLPIYLHYRGGNYPDYELTINYR